MLKSKDKTTLYKKQSPTMEPQPIYHLNDELMHTSPQRRSTTMQSRYSKVPYLNQTDSVSSSRIAQQKQPLDKNYQSFQADILRKVELMEQQTNSILQKKQRQLYFIRIQLQNNEARLYDAEQALIIRNQEVKQLQHKLQAKGKPYNYSQTRQNYRLLEQENEKLKESLGILIEQKNQNWKYHQNKRENFSSQQVEGLKLEVQGLRAMVSEMEGMVYRCPTCYTLRRDLEQLNEAYNCLAKEHSSVKQQKESKEQDLLKNITHKIEQNQNILRENNHLRQERPGKPFYLRPKRQKLKESVAKRCRTLTDHF